MDTGNGCMNASTAAIDMRSDNPVAIQKRTAESSLIRTDHREVRVRVEPRASTLACTATYERLKIHTS
jgi:hypothetical protein